MANNVELHNPSTEGVGGLKGIRFLSREDTSKLGVSGDALFRQQSTNYLQNTPAIQNVGFIGLNDSRFDKHITSSSELEDLNEFRANTQSNIEQIGLGLVKGVTLAGTTFLDGTVGAAVGLLAGIGNAFDKNEQTTFWEGLWNNEFSKLMN